MLQKARSLNVYDLFKESPPILSTREQAETIIDEILILEQSFITNKSPNFYVLLDFVCITSVKDLFIEELFINFANKYPNIHLMIINNDNICNTVTKYIEQNYN